MSASFHCENIVNALLVPKWREVAAFQSWFDLVMIPGSLLDNTYPMHIGWVLSKRDL